MGYIHNPRVTVLSWPTGVEPRTRTLHRTGKSSAHVSPINRATQTQELVGGVWTGKAQFPPLDDEQQRVMRVFIPKLRGTSGFFDFCAESTVAEIPAQPAGQNLDIVADGPRLAVQVSPRFLETHGWDDAPGTLLIGASEHISYDDATGWRRLHVVVEDCFAQPTGLASMKVEPPVRHAVAPDGRLHLDCPNGIFKLASDEEGAITQSPESGEMSISIIEAFSPRVIIE
jgi:hypothetical protein